jgi:hypothetical protein
VWEQIRVDDMELAGELVQDLCKYLGLEELESTANFPAEMDSLRTVLAQVGRQAGHRSLNPSTMKKQQVSVRPGE